MQFEAPKISFYTNVYYFNILNNYWNPKIHHNLRPKVYQYTSFINFFFFFRNALTLINIKSKILINYWKMV